MDKLVADFTSALDRQLGAKCAVYRYNADFATLWSDSVPSDKPLLIIWDEGHLGDVGNRDEMLLERHLTPLDWALAWSLRNAKRPLMPIVIVDLTPASWKGSWAWSMRHQLVADMPWLRLTALVVDHLPGTQPHALAMQSPATFRGNDTEGAIRRIEGGNGPAEWRLMLDSTPRKLEVEEKSTLTALYNLWLGSLNQTDEQHDINNVVGGWMLLAESRDATKSRVADAPLGGEEGFPRSEVTQAFLTKIEWSRQKDGKSRQRWLPRPRQRDDPELYGRTPRVRIYDDKAAAGWEQVAKLALRHTTADVTQGDLDSLVKQVASMTFRERRFSAEADIVLLDLRLYDSPESDQLRLHVTSLANKAREISKWPSSLAWPAIDAGELTRIESWLKLPKRSAGRAYLEALLLLPRMVALARPLTPIILFSSSSQARVRELLKPYRNIFTGFQKPNALRDPQSIEVAADAFNRGIEFSLPLLSRGIWLAAVGQIAHQAETLHARPAGMRTAHADLYFDESGEAAKGVISAVACNIYASSRVSSSLQEFLRKQLSRPASRLKKGTEFGDPTEASAQVSALYSYISSVDDATDYLDHWMISGVRAPSYSSSRDISLSSFPDLSLDRAIRANLFFSIFVYIPWATRSNDSTVTIHLPSRTLEKDVDRLSQAFGLSQVRVRGVPIEKYYTYSREAAFPLVRAWLQSWGEAFISKSKSIISIAGRTLHSDIVSYSEHLFHDIADWAAGSVGVHGNPNEPRTAYIKAAFKEHGLYQRRYVCIERGGQHKDDFVDLEKLLTALSDIRRGKLSPSGLADAIGDLERVQALANSEGLYRLETDDSLAHHRMVLWALMPYIHKASGEALMPVRSAPA